MESGKREAGSGKLGGGCRDCPLAPFGGCGGQTSEGVRLPPCAARARLVRALYYRAVELAVVAIGERIYRDLMTPRRYPMGFMPVRLR